MRRASPYRTVTFLAFLALLLFAGLVLCSHIPSESLADKLFTTFMLGVASIGGFAVGKSVGEHAAYGPGLGGIAKVLMTDAKPGEQPAAPPALPPGPLPGGHA